MNLKCQMIYLLICDIAFLIFELELLHIAINLVQRYGDWNENPRIDHQSECHRNEKPYASWRPFYMIGRKIINSWDRNWFLLQFWVLLLVEVKKILNCITWKETCFFTKPGPVWSTFWWTKLNNHSQQRDNQRQTVRKPNKQLVSLGIGGIASVMENN